jgi:hypothetical protein
MWCAGILQLTVDSESHSALTVVLKPTRHEMLPVFFSGTAVMVSNTPPYTGPDDGRMNFIIGSTVYSYTTPDIEDLPAVECATSTTTARLSNPAGDRHRSDVDEMVVATTSLNVPNTHSMPVGRKPAP